MSGFPVVAAWRRLPLPSNVRRIVNRHYPLLSDTCTRNYATKKQKGTDASVMAKKAPLNMDVCLGANYFKTGEDPVIRPEEEYPEWLWSLEPDKQTDIASDTKQYWRRVRKKQAHAVIATLREKH